jgi:hypothetical protein
MPDFNCIFNLLTWRRTDSGCGACTDTYRHTYSPLRAARIASQRASSIAPHTPHTRPPQARSARRPRTRRQAVQRHCSARSRDTTTCHKGALVRARGGRPSMADHRCKAPSNVRCMLRTPRGRCCPRRCCPSRPGPSTFRGTAARAQDLHRPQGHLVPDGPAAVGQMVRCACQVACRPRGAWRPAPRGHSCRVRCRLCRGHVQPGPQHRCGERVSGPFERESGCRLGPEVARATSNWLISVTDG